MSLNTLELDRFSLSDPAESLKLEVASAAVFKVPRNFSNLDSSATLNALNLRQVWVSRGRGCRIDIEVLLDGTPLNRIDYLYFLQILGCRIRDAEPWKQLFISTSLEILPEVLDNRQPHISFGLKHSTQPLGRQVDLAAWLGGTIDVNPPDGVVCWEFERLQIQFNFLRIPRRPPSTIRARAGSESLDLILLDIPEDNTGLCGTRLDYLENVVGGLRALQDQISSYFAMATGSDPGLSNPKKRLRGPPTEGTHVAQEWFNAHSTHPYPTNEEQLQLMLRTGLKEDQLKSTPSRQRQKLGKVAPSGDNIPDEDEMLLHDDYDYQTMDAQLEVEVEDEDEMLFSQSFTSSTSASTLSSISLDTPVSSGTSLANQTEISLPIPSACDLVHASISTLFGGCMRRRRIVRLREFEVSKPPPILSMSRLVPTMFCPGFKQSMAQHSRFLPTISHAISVSWPRNVQTPSLRRKLMQLSNADSSPFHDHPAGVGEPGTSERLSSVVQSRLWGMMQRSLCDGAAGRKLWQQGSTKETANQDNSDFEDILSIGKGDDDHLVGIKCLEEVSGDGMLVTDNENDELLFGEDDRKDDSYWERCAIELETDEILFGSEWSKAVEEDEVMMLLDSDQSNFHEADNNDGDMLLPDEGEGDEMLI